MDHEPINMFRKATSFLYREIGILEPRNHSELYARADKQHGFFSPARKRIARELYHQTKNEQETRAVLEPYEKATGLRLGDIHRAFAEGNWKNSSGGYSYGGPKWTAIAKATIKLRKAIDKSDHAEAQRQTEMLGHLPHNNGCLVDKFIEL